MGWRGFGFVHRSRTLFCRAAPNPNIAIRHFFIAVCDQARRAFLCLPTWVHAGEREQRREELEDAKHTVDAARSRCVSLGTRVRESRHLESSAGALARLVSWSVCRVGERIRSRPVWSQHCWKPNPLRVLPCVLHLSRAFLT
jgi:hypothetical protein